MCGYQRIVSFPHTCRADCSNSTNLNLTRVSVRFSGFSPEASFRFPFAGSLDIQKNGYHLSSSFSNFYQHTDPLVVNDVRLHASSRSR